MEETLRLSAAMLAATLDTSPHLIMLHAEDGEILQVSGNWLRLTGYAADEMRTMESWLRLAHGSAWKIVAERIALLYGLRHPQAGGEFQIRTKDGRHLTWDFISVPLAPLPDGRRVLMTLAADVTVDMHEVEQLITAKTKAEAAQASKSRFVAAASHELRQPMQAIKILVDALGNTELSAEQKQIAKYLNASCTSLSHLLDTLVDISKLDAGIVRPAAVPASIGGIFRRLENELAPLAQERGLRFGLFAPRRPLGLRTDPNLLQIMLRNLVGNAIKYTDRGGLLLAARLRPHELLIQVWDTGIGIEATDMPHLYEEFFQAEQARQRDGRGLGLGLSIVKRLARLLDYELACRSRPGRGTVFELRIPLLEMPANAALAADLPAAARFADLGGRYCIVVDDDLLLTKALEFLFGRLNARVSSFATAEDALAHPEILDADYYICDGELGGKMDGIELLDTIEARAGRKIKGLVLTGDETGDKAADAVPPRWRTLAKPPCLSELLSAMQPEQDGNEASAGRA